MFLSRVNKLEFSQWLALAVLVALISFMVVPGLAWAQNIPNYNPVKDQPNTLPQGVNTLVQKISFVLGTIIMGLAVIMILWSAFLFMTAGENKEGTAKARLTLIYALIGIAISLLAFFLPNIVANIFGTTLGGGVKL